MGAKAGHLFARYGLRSVALLYLLFLLVLPVGMVVYYAFDHGLGVFWDAISSPDALHALYLTVLITCIAVPLNTVFGIIAALVLVRRRVPGRTLISALIDLPLALSPVVVGLCVVLVWGKYGWFGFVENDLGYQVVFAVPGMVLATVFVCLPFVVREVIPVLREVGTEQEEAASTLGAGGWQAFWRITLPSIRWGVIYGVVLTTARALGEYGAVAVVSGRITGKSETMTLFVAQQYQQIGPDSQTAAYSASLVLVLLAVITVASMSLLNRRGGSRGDRGH